MADGVRTELTDIAAFDLQSQAYPIVFRPHSDLFADLDKQMYRGGSVQGKLRYYQELTKAAVDLIALYSPDLANRFCCDVRVIAFMPSHIGDGRSFSMRNFYIGGIFVSDASPLVVAEQFIHELYHQSIWPWWWLEPIDDLPDAEVTIVSAVTGRIRQVRVMVQALLIYCSLIDFYRFILSRKVDKHCDADANKKAHKRLIEIEHGVPALLASLREALSNRPRALAAVEFLSTLTQL
jgi:hypothetical protein